MSIAATQITGNITVLGNVYLDPSSTGFTELRGNTNAGAIRFNCEVNTHGVTLKGPPHSASATYELELPDADGSAVQFFTTDGSGKLSCDTVSVNNISGDVTITGELLADSYNEKFKRVSSVVTTTASSTMTDWSYESKSLSVASQDGIPNGMAFNNDETKSYISGNSNDTIYQYALTTAYDVSTGSYESKSFSVATQVQCPCGLAFNTSGTKMYVQDFNADTVFQYSLSTAFDVSTAFYDSVSLDASGQDTSTQAMVFKPDGTSLFIAGNTNDTVYQYDLTTAFDLSTASYASKSFSVTSQQGFPTGIAFSSDGFDVSGGLNVASRTLWGWSWKANGSGVSNNVGSIPSTVSANTTAGFSIVSYTGTGANTTVGHGLGTAPKFIFLKSRTTVEPWLTYHGSLSPA